MDHLDAENVKAAEWYVLGELAVSEVEEFERHFFDCPQCSEELRALTIFQENARAVFAEQDLTQVPASEQQAPESAAGWWRGFSPLFFGARAAAMVMAALVIGIFAGRYAFSAKDNVQVVAAYPLYAQARSEETVIAPAAGSKFYTFYFDRSWDGEYASYRATLRDSSGAEKLAIPVTLGSPGESVHVLVPAHALAGGRYVLVMSGRSADRETELARFPFTLQLK